MANYFAWLKDDPQLLQLQPATFKMLCNALLLTEHKAGKWTAMPGKHFGGTQMNYTYEYVITYSCCNRCPGHGIRYYSGGDQRVQPKVHLGGDNLCHGLKHRFPAITTEEPPKSFEHMIDLMTAACRVESGTQ